MQNNPSPQLAAFLPQNNMDTVLINQLSTGIREAILINILLQILSFLQTGSTGGAVIVSGDFGGVPPPFNLSVPTGIAFDTSNGTQWAWYSGAWH